MKLSTVHITEFESIRDSNRFDIGDITCLVGKNEAGKTALLQALYRLNPIIPGDAVYDITDDYPRVDVEDYRQEIDADGHEHATVVQATFTLDEEEIQSIQDEFGEGVLVEPTLTLSRGYDNQLGVDLSVDEKAAVGSILESAQLPTDVSKRFSKHATLEALAGALPAETDDEENSEHIKRLQERLAAVQEQEDLSLYIYENHLAASVPKFLYFDEYYRMRGHENVEALKERHAKNKLEPSDRPLLGLIELARLNLDELLNPDRTQELKNKLEGAGNHLTKRILKYWSQNRHLQMRFDVRPGRPGDPEGMRDGTNIWAEVYDSKHFVTTAVGTRSKGFVWFFSFLAWFSQKQKTKEPLILLLDEPGLSLHGKAQADLLRYIDEELKPDHQVVYTTHSPFMVDPQRFDRVRIVQDKSMDEDQTLPAKQEGTKVFTDVLRASDDSLFPLQGALGYEIHQSLFVGPNSLIVEGVSDLLFLQTISGILERQGRVGLSPNWTITPVGGSDKVPTFVALLGSQKGMTLATLIDIQKKDRQTIEELYKRKLLKKKNVLTFADFVDEDEADIEDMFGEGFYLMLVNAEFKSALSSPVKKTALPQGGVRILPRLQQYFDDNPLKGKNHFNHYRPARYFSENVAAVEGKLPPEALDRFEAAFKALNALL